jgi:lysozyme family protein
VSLCICLQDIAMTDIATLKAANARRWANVMPTRDFSAVVKHLVSPDARSRYRAVSAKTGVPWPVIAVIHERECAQDWTGSLAQGDPWNRISVHVPAGRGPFKSWEEAAIDALDNCAPYAGRNKDWSIGALLTKLEEYNGLGYAARGVPSPYVWAGTDQYRSGKYVRDGVYDPNVVDSQPGCAGLLMAMMALDPTITFPATSPVAIAQKVPSTNPSFTRPAKGSVGAWVASLLFSIFKSKGK